jgi:hypothetical protein
VAVLETIGDRVAVQLAEVIVVGFGKLLAIVFKLLSYDFKVRLFFVTKVPWKEFQDVGEMGDLLVVATVVSKVAYFD